MKTHKDLSMNILQGILVAMLFAVLLFFFLGEILLPAEETTTENCTLFQAEWVRLLPNGETVAVDVPGECEAQAGEVVRLKTKLPMNQEDTWFCTRSSQQDVRIFVDGELRKEYTTKDSRPFGKNSASTYVFFYITEEDAGKELIVETVSWSSYAGVINEFLMGERHDIWQHLFGRYAIRTLIAFFLLILSVITVVLSLLVRLLYKNEMEILYLGLGLLLASFWMFAESKLRQYFLPNISVACSVGFFVTMLLPYPFAIYINLIQKRRYQKIYKGIAICVVANSIIATTLQVLNIKEFMETLVISHIIIGFGVIASVFTIILDIKKKKINDYKEVAVGFTGFMVAALYEVYLVYVKISHYDGVPLCMGLCFLLFMAGLKTGRDMQKAEKEKQRVILAGESKTKFLANMSHEIRTPINTIIGMNEMVLRENQNEIVQEYSVNIKNASQLLLGLINDILDFSKIEAGKMALTEEEYSVSGLLSIVAQGLKFKTESKNLQMKLEIEETLPSILLGDEIRIRQILNNLLSNAVKYTKEGTITLSVKGIWEEEKFSLVLSVADTGQGIRKEDMERLFDSFHRLEEKRNRFIEGTGLGLNITRQLAELMGGTIEVQSEYGKGSCFTVCLPQQVVDSTPIGTLESACRKTESEEKNTNTLYAPTACVLAVDDNEMNRSVLKALLLRTGIQLDLASGGLEGLELCRKKQYDLIIMDHMMPAPDGIETLHMLRAEKQNKNTDTKVLVFTANAISGSAQQYIEEGFTDYISKPIVSSELEKMLLKYLPKEKLEDEERGCTTPGQGEHQANEEELAENPWIDWDQGLMYCAGNKEVYLEILKMFYHQGTKNLDLISEYVEKGDLNNYRITVHSVKSTALSVGANGLSEYAKEMELAAKENNIEKMQQETGAFLEDYQTVLNVIAKNLVK
ncbi:MAG: response regulator [Lachnospiraceae bacterium]|nr:response regulator [Lachnospiraceae bacterium]